MGVKVCNNYNLEAFGAMALPVCAQGANSLLDIHILEY